MKGPDAIELGLAGELCGTLLDAPVLTMLGLPWVGIGDTSDSAKPLLPAMLLLLLLLRPALLLLEASLPLPPDMAELAEPRSFPRNDFVDRRAGKAGT